MEIFLTTLDQFFFFFEGIQIVRVIMYLSRTLVTKMQINPDHEIPIKAIILGGSILCYIISIYIVYNLYQHPAINVPLSSYLAALCVILVILSLVAVFVVEAGIISDIAIISLFVIFIARSAFLEQPIQSSNGIFDSFYHFNYIVNMFNGSFQIGTTKVNFSQFFSFDFLISALLAISTLLSFPVLWEESDDELAQTDEEEENQVSFQKNLFSVLLVMLYTHVLLTATGNITPSGVVWRILQSVVTLIFYCWRLYVVSQQDELGFVSFKQD